MASCPYRKLLLFAISLLAVGLPRDLLTTRLFVPFEEIPPVLAFKVVLDWCVDIWMSGACIAGRCKSSEVSIEIEASIGVVVDEVEGQRGRWHEHLA